MSRRRVTAKRKTLGDPKYHDQTVAKFINTMMRDGKKSVAEKILYEAMEIAQAQTGTDLLKVFQTALQNVQPQLEVKSRRVGGATYQIPVVVRDSRKNTLAIRWIIDAARKRNEKSMTAKLAAELVDAASEKGGAVRKREDVHRMAEANKAFSHYRF